MPLCHAFQVSGIPFIGGNLRQGDHHEGSVGHAWVRDFEAWLADPQIAVEQDVQIEGARPVLKARGPIAAELLLDPHQTLQQSARREAGFQRDNGVDESGLCGIANRCGGVEGRPAGDSPEGLKAVYSSREGCVWRSRSTGQVAAHSDVGCRHLLQSNAYAKARGNRPIWVMFRERRIC